MLILKRNRLRYSSFRLEGPKNQLENISPKITPRQGFWGAARPWSHTLSYLETRPKIIGVIIGWWQKDMLSKLFSLVIYINYLNKMVENGYKKMPIHVDDINQSIITAKVTWSDACNNGYWACMWLSISTIKSEHGITLITFSAVQSYMPPFYSFHAITLITIMTFPLKADHIKSIIYSLF